MKYIVLALGGKEDLFTFPAAVSDEEILDACKAIRFGDRNWTRKYHEATVVAAGVIADGICSGGSEFLGAHSRGEIDSFMVRGMDCKYIMLALDQDQAEIVTFPRTVDHDRMAEACERIRFGHDTRCNEKYKDGQILSAGFITSRACHGRSESLDMDSRPQFDTDILAQALRAKKSPALSA